MNPEELDFYTGPTTGNRRMKKRLNSVTSFRRCHALELTGWYSQDIYQRLIGHYRLFQLFKKDKYLKYRNKSPYQAYILHYRGTHGLKLAVSKTMAFIFSPFTKEPFPMIEIGALNSILVNEGGQVLLNFLIESEIDFEAALLKAVAEIETLDFMCLTGKGASATNNYNLQINNDLKVNSNLQVNNNLEINNDLRVNKSLQINNYYPAAGKGAQGKEKGVFSKRQILMVMDLLAGSGAVERIDYRKPNKFDNIALVLQAVTGKKASSFKEELMDYKGKGPYDWNTQGELDQLIRELINLAELFREAGFHSIAEQADKKIRELQKREKP